MTSIHSLPVLLMRWLLLILTFCFLSFFDAASQTNQISSCPNVSVTVTLLKNTFKVSDDISLTITLTNDTKSTQSVWFHKPKSTMGGPAWTSVLLINSENEESVLKYQNKAILESQLYTTEQVKKFSYQLKPGQKISGQFSLFDLVVLKNTSNQLDKGNYEMQVFYCSHGSDKITFTVD